MLCERIYRSICCEICEDLKREKECDSVKFSVSSKFTVGIEKYSSLGHGLNATIVESRESNES